ncbi:MAG: DUF3445 domain-containing protein [Acidimicrobiia bacterium]|nr:DUF3445 domain-containing protein [Acidimicrobiia bacterium]
MPSVSTNVARTARSFRFDRASPCSARFLPFSAGTTRADMAIAPDYQPYVAGPFRWRLALRPLDLSDWIQIGDDYDHEMDAKSVVLSEHHDTVVAVIDGIEDEAAEILRHLCDHLCATWPTWFVREGNEIVNRRRNERWSIAPSADGSWALHPLDVAGRLVQEDMALLVIRDGRPIDSFFERLSVDKPFWRLGWGVLDTDDPYQPMDGTASEPPPLPVVGDPTAGDRLFLRVERETLRRFPETECVLFTIRTYIRPLSHLVERPEDARRLAEALSQLPDDVRDYKQTTELTAAAVHWLSEVSGNQAHSPGGR